jgi:hypothetical protein
MLEFVVVFRIFEQTNRRIRTCSKILFESIPNEQPLFIAVRIPGTAGADPAVVETYVLNALQR